MKKPNPNDFNQNGTTTVTCLLDAYLYRRDVIQFYEHWHAKMLKACEESAEYGLHGQPLNKSAEIVDFFYKDQSIDPRAK